MARDSAGQTPGTANMPESQRETLDHARKCFERAKATRSHYEPDWFLNLSYVVGDQWVYWNRGHLERPRFDTRDPVTDNRMQGIVNTRIARKTKSRPVFVATPTSADEADMESARLTDQVLESDWEELKLTKKLYAALNWSEIICAGFWKIYYDPTKGKSDDYLVQRGEEGASAYMGEDGRPMRVSDHPEGEPMPEGVEPMPVAQGEACIEVISPFEFFPDPLATSMEDLEWCVEVKVRSVDYVQERYGFKADPDTDAPLGIAESRMTGFSVLPGMSGASSRTTKQRGVKVYEFWSKPSPRFPDGVKICWCNETILHQDDKPFDAIPYVMFGAQDVPGRFWPMTCTTQLRGPQTQLNRTKTQIYENLARIGNPIMLWSRYAGKMSYRGLPGETIYYDDTTPNSVPRYLNPPEIPVYMREEVERIEGSMQEIAGLHEVSKATVPAGVTAASAINLLQEADDTRLGPEVAATEQSVAEAGRKLMRVRAAYTDDSRMVKIAGEDGDWDIQEWKGTMLDESVGVSVQSGSMMPRSKAAKQAAILEVMQVALQYGLPLQPRNIRRVLREYEIGGLDRLFADIGRDEEQIQWENRMLSQGQQLPINSFDDDDLHIVGHEEYCKTGRWRRLPPEAQQLILQHIAEHRARRVAATNAQIQTMQQEAAGSMQAQTEQTVTQELAKAAVSPASQNGGA
jgi:hypothetical protein